MRMVLLKGGGGSTQPHAPPSRYPAGNLTHTAEPLEPLFPRPPVCTPMQPTMQPPHPQ